MTMIRATQQSIADRKAAVNRLKSEIARLEAIHREKDGVLWKEMLGPSVKASIEANQAALDNILDAQVEDPARDFANLKALRGAIRAYQNIYQEVEKSPAIIERKRAQIEAIAAELKAIDEEGHL